MAATESTLELRFAFADDAALAARAPAEWRVKAASMRFERDARLERVAGGLLAEMLAARGVATPRFALGRFGKPELADAVGLHFSLAHSDAVVLCAVADRPVGCDVERLVVGPSRNRDFYERWTRREAGLKMTGCGFANGAGFDDPPHPAARNIWAPEGYVAAICLQDHRDEHSGICAASRMRRSRSDTPYPY